MRKNSERIFKVKCLSKPPTCLCFYYIIVHVFNRLKDRNFASVSIFIKEAIVF